MTAEVSASQFVSGATLLHAAAAERFADFRTAAETLQAEVDCMRPDIRRHPAFVDQGYFNETYALGTDQGVYAMRLAKPKAGAAGREKLADKSTALALAAGVVCAEKLVAHGPGMLVTEWMPGKRFDKLTPEDHESVTDIQLLDLIRTIEILDRRRVGIDINPHNLFLDAQKGFGVIDLQTKEQYRSLRADLLVPEVAYILTKGYSISDPANAGNRLTTVYGDCSSSLKRAEPLGQKPADG